MRNVPTVPKSPESQADLQLEIAHLLLIDIVGYSRLLVDEQIELMQELTRIIRSTETFRAAEARGQLDSHPYRRRDGIGFFPEPGGASPVRAGDQRQIKASSEDSLTHGYSQWAGESAERRE